MKKFNEQLLSSIWNGHKAWDQWIKNCVQFYVWLLISVSYFVDDSVKKVAEIMDYPIRLSPKGTFSFLKTFILYVDNNRRAYFTNWFDDVEKKLCTSKVFILYIKCMYQVWNATIFKN